MRHVFTQDSESRLSLTYFAQNMSVSLIAQTHDGGPGVSHRYLLERQDIPDVPERGFASEHALEFGEIEVVQHFDYGRNTGGVGEHSEPVEA